MRERRHSATASVVKIFLLAPGTFRRGSMLVNFTDQGLKGVKDVPNRQDKSRETVSSDFPRRRMLQPTLPAGFIAPCLPSKTDKLPSGSQWLHEIKHDGFRIIARKT